MGATWRAAYSMTVMLRGGACWKVVCWAHHVDVVRALLVQWTCWLSKSKRRIWSVSVACCCMQCMVFLVHNGLAQDTDANRHKHM